MEKQRTRIWLLIGTVTVLVMALGITVAFAQEGEDAVTPDVAPEGVPEDESSNPLPFYGQFGRGRQGQGAARPRNQGLDSARPSFQGLDSARPSFQGLDSARPSFQGLDSARPKFGDGLEGITPRGQLLADALGIELDDLVEAQESAHNTWLAEMVANGYMEQEQADLMLAYQALKGNIDRHAIMASVLGFSETELEAAREDGQGLSTLLEEQGLTVEEFVAAMETAYQDAVQDLVPEVLTQEQADRILESGEGMPGFRGMPRFGGGMQGRGGASGFNGSGFPCDNLTSGDADV
jgi:hypothetical protein